MKYQRNIERLEALDIDWMGLIFYPKSPRYVKHSLTFKNKEIKKMGVFVNASDHFIQEKINQYNLGGIQFHGDEEPTQCNRFRNADMICIKAFSIDNDFDFNRTNQYSKVCDYFIFDTKGEVPGGTGKTFSWSILKRYEGSIPFLLSGGIGRNQLSQLKEFAHPQWAGIDLNSQFESRPGFKKIGEIKKFTHEYFS